MMDVSDRQHLSLLCISSSPRRHSVSRSLCEFFIGRLLATMDDLEVQHRDLARDPPPYVTEDWITASYADSACRDASMCSILRQSDIFTDELVQADCIVISSPMYNFSVPASLKAYIDLVARPGVTFASGPTGPSGLLRDRPVLAITTSGGRYRPDTLDARYDYYAPYLRTFLGFLGILDVTFVSCDGLNEGRDQRNATITKSRAALELVASAWLTYAWPQQKARSAEVTAAGNRWA